jgi:CheY-like chemotaxis protein
MVRHWQMAPTVTDSGAGALAVLEEASQRGVPFRLVLLDAHMPGAFDGLEVAKRVQQRPELAGATILMLTSMDGRGAAARCRQLGVAGYLVKPLARRELLAAMLDALGAAPARASASPVPPVHAPSPSLRILLAEDNVVNQVVAAAMLKREGHCVTIVANGRAAVDASAADPFDLILMDVQMPDMNGFEATAAIRVHESTRGGHVPIVALTAHAMEGDRDRCLEAGMDDYVSKPLRLTDLQRVIAAVSTAIAEARLAVPL